MKTVKHDPTASVTYFSDWTSHLNALPYDATVTSATVTVDRGAVIESTSAVPTGVLFRLSVADVPLGTTVVVTVSAGLSNGDTDVRRHPVTVAKT